MSVRLSKYRPAFRAGKSTVPQAGLSLNAEPSLVPPPAGYDRVGTLHAGQRWIVDELRCQNTGQRTALIRLRGPYRQHAPSRELLANAGRTGLRMRSRYIAQVLDSNLEGPDPYLLQEWLPGDSLRNLLQRRRRLSIELCAWIARQYVHGLKHLERAGFSHGDVRPENLIVSPIGAVKWIGLGHSQPMTENPPASDPPTLPADAIAYRPLETSVQPDLPQTAIDIYGVGVVLFEMLTGRRPFDAPTAAGIRRLQSEGELPSVTRWRGDAPPALAELTHRLLAQRPEERPGSLEDVLRELFTVELSSLTQPGLAA